MTEMQLTTRNFTLQERQQMLITHFNQLIFFKEIIRIYCDNNMTHVNMPCGQNEEFFKC